MLKRCVSLSTRATRSIAMRKARKNSTYFFTAGFAFSTWSSAAWRARKSRSALIVATRFATCAGLGRLPERDLAPVGGDRRRELRAGALQRRRGGGRPAGVALAVGAAAELVGLRAARLAGLALGEELAVRDLPLEARLLALHRRDLLLRRRDLRVVELRDLVRRLVDTGRRRLAELVVDRAAVDHLAHRQPDHERDREREHEARNRDQRGSRPSSCRSSSGRAARSGSRGRPRAAAPRGRS